MSASRILLYTPNLIGHPQVYCRVIGDILINSGCEVLIATGAIESSPAEWNELAVFDGHTSVEFLDTRKYSKMGVPDLTAEELKQVQVDHQIDSTLFIEGDYFKEQFIRISEREAPRLEGRNVAIFAHTTIWCPGEELFFGKPIPKFAPTLRGNLGRVKRFLLNWKLSDKYFFNTVLIKQKVVDAVVVKDERILEKYGAPVYWLPDIYRVFGKTEEKEKDKHWEQFSEEINQYIGYIGKSNVILYFGTGTYYKGYDYFLNMLATVKGTGGLHLGGILRDSDKPHMIYDVEKNRKMLKQENRLYETKVFVESDRLINHIFEGVERFVSTHRLTGSSGTMLHALELGKPVLVPDAGLLGYLVRKHNLGMTYSYIDSDLETKWREFKNEPIDSYRASIDKFNQRYSFEAVSSFFRKLLEI